MHLTELMTGKTFDKVVAAQDKSAARQVLEIEGLSRRGEYEDISLTIRAGEVVGLSGLIGAGRTELAHALRHDQGRRRHDQPRRQGAARTDAVSDAKGLQRRMHSCAKVRCQLSLMESSHYAPEGVDPLDVVGRLVLLTIAVCARPAVPWTGAVALGSCRTRRGCAPRVWPGRDNRPRARARQLGLWGKSASAAPPMLTVSTTGAPCCEPQNIDAET
jgi:hypothetical protein